MALFPLWSFIGIQQEERFGFLRNHCFEVCGRRLCLVLIISVFVSGVHGAVTGISGLIIVFSCYHDAIGAKMNMTYTSNSIFCGYFYYDLLIMYYGNSQKLVDVSFMRSVISYLCAQPIMIAHHVFTASWVLPMALYHFSIGHFFVGALYCAELSSPFLNARIVMSSIGMKSSKLYVVNGFLMMTIFFMCRIILCPVMYAVYLSQQNSAPTNVQAMMDIPMKCHLTCWLLLALQIYWMYCMIRGSIALRRKPSDTASMEKHD